MESEVQPQRPKTNTSKAHNSYQQRNKLQNLVPLNVSHVNVHLRKVLGQNYQNPSAAMTCANSVPEFPTDPKLIKNDHHTHET